jgi:hypothetical protein
MKKSDMLSMKFGEEINKTEVLLDEKEIGRIKDVKKRLELRKQLMKKRRNIKK